MTCELVPCDLQLSTLFDPDMKKVKAWYNGLSCDAAISVLKEEKNGEILNIGRKSRIIPPTMRRALRSRDQGCRFHHRLVHEGGFILKTGSPRS